MNEEQLRQVKMQLKDALGYSMEMWLASAIQSAIDNEDEIQSLFDDYYDSSLRYFGVKPLPKA